MPTDEYPGAPINLEEARTEPTVKFATYGSERLDPGQDAIQSLDVEFPGRSPGGEEAARRSAWRSRTSRCRARRRRCILKSPSAASKGEHAPLHGPGWEAPCCSRGGNSAGAAPWIFI
jgi:hypothetical protein